MSRWTPEMEAIAVGMKRAGLSGAAIAERLGVSRQAVAHKTHRKGACRRLDRRRGKGTAGLGRIMGKILGITSDSGLEQE